MKKVLERAMPAYAQSLFQSPRIAEKIENVEIVGFASPTFKGKYVDPSKLGNQEREAVNYNLDLSYSRARSIFDHIYSKMTFNHKQRLLPLVKVTGKSFLGDKANRNVSSGDSAAFCEALAKKSEAKGVRFRLGTTLRGLRVAGDAEGFGVDGAAFGADRAPGEGERGHTTKRGESP
jgi:hypothetical protein